MTITTLDGKSLCEQLADNYKRSLPKTPNKRGVVWTMESFSTYVSLLYPEVRVVDGQEWTGNRAKYQFECEKHGGYSAAANHILNPKYGNNCRECMYELTSSLVGKVRRPRATPEEIQQVIDLYNKLGNQREVARRMGRSQTFVQRCINPKFRQQQNEKNLARSQSPEDKQRQKGNRLIFRQTEHGKQSERQASNKRRALEWEASFSVLIDDVWYEVEMYDYLETWEEKTMFVEQQSVEDYALLMVKAKEMELEHGEKFEIDHLIPLSRGGLHHSSNFQIKTKKANNSKLNKRLLEDDTLFCKRIFGIN
jgi:hypothetical protein